MPAWPRAFSTTFLGNSLRASNAAYENLKKDVGELLSFLEVEDLSKVSEVATSLILGMVPSMFPDPVVAR